MSSIRSCDDPQARGDRGGCRSIGPDATHDATKQGSTPSGCVQCVDRHQFSPQDIGEHLTPGGMHTPASGQPQDSYLVCTWKGLQGSTDAECHPFEGCMQQMLPLMIDAQAQEGSPAVRVLVMGTLTCQIGEERDTSGTGCYYTSTRVEFIPTGTQCPVNPVEVEARVLYCRHPIPVDSISSTVEMDTPAWVGEMFWTELRQLHSGPQRQLDRTRGKQAGPQAGCGGISGAGCHGQPRSKAECSRRSCRKRPGACPRWR